MFEVKVDIGGHDLVFQSGRLAKQSNGSVLAMYEGVSVLSTVCCGSSPKEDLDFIPLQVEYNEKYYAAGKIPGGFIKRETRPKEKEILVSRLIDRPIRPLFSKQFMRDIQLIPTTISSDQVNPADVVAMCAAFTSVMISDIPFDGPVGAVRVIHTDTEGLIVNPTFTQIGQANLEIVVAGTEEGITMVEGGAHEVSEDLLLEAIEFARPYISNICKAQRELADMCGKEKLPLIEKVEFALADEITAHARPAMEEACYVKGKFERVDAIKKVIETTIQHFDDRLVDEDTKKVHEVLDTLEQEIVRNTIIEKKLRTDGRGLEDIRPIECMSHVLPRTHGTALFTRGETQALAVVTLGTAVDEQVYDDIDGDRRDNFLLHYNFPPFSVGETGRLGTGRREVGHGHLAYRALQPMMPKKEDFPYTVRVVSEVLESNGSSSMATVCSGSLALMDAGVPIRKSVAGIAMGLIKEGDKTAVLSDILGEEDHLGDMDFKVAGTEEGITGFQMDIKVKNIDAETMRIALTQAKAGRMHILGIMNKTLNHSRDDLSQYAPRIISFQVEPDKIGLLIGSGGKTIRSVNEKYSVETNIDDSGSVTIYSQQSHLGEAAKESFLQLLEEPEMGKEYPGVVRRITEFGAFIEILPGKEGLCHISRISKQRIKSVENVLSINMELPVKIIEIDRLGRINLSLVNPIEVPESEVDSSEGGDGSYHDRRRSHHSRDRDSRDRDSRDRNSRDRGQGGNRHFSR